MSFTAGIIGLPNVGKSTIFNSLTAADAEASAYPFCTIEPNTAIVPVVESRLSHIVSLIQPPKWAAATIKILDVAGLVKGASQGEGLGNQFLGHIRTVDVVIHVVRCFRNDEISHVHGKLDPEADIDITNTELLLSDLDILQKRKIKIKKLLRGGNKALAPILDFADRVELALSQGQPARLVPLFSSEESSFLNEFELLTAKPVIYLANIGEPEIQGESAYISSVRDTASDDNAEFLTICGDLESGIAEMDEHEQIEFRSEYNLDASSLERLLAAVVRKLDLITFYTIVGNAVRSWIIPRGTPAQDAAGKIHSDMEKGFIKAEALHYDELMEMEGWTQAREKGLVRIEGKKYLIQDGDVVLFRFNV